MGFFGFLLLIIFVVIVLGFALLHSIVNALLRFFGLSQRTSSGGARGTNSQSGTYHNDQPGTSSRNSRQKRNTSSPSKGKKIFSDEDGEYVDYEEIKEP